MKVTLESYPSKTAGREFWVVWAGGVRVGNIFTTKRKKDDRICLNIVMDEPERNKGYGTVALKEFMENTNHEEVYAETHKSNLPMRRVFNKLGWKPIDYLGPKALYRWRNERNRQWKN